MNGILAVMAGVVAMTVLTVVATILAVATIGEADGVTRGKSVSPFAKYQTIDIRVLD